MFMHFLYEVIFSFYTKTFSFLIFFLFRVAVAPSSRKKVLVI